MSTVMEAIGRATRFNDESTPPVIAKAMPFAALDPTCEAQILGFVTTVLASIPPVTPLPLVIAVTRAGDATALTGMTSQCCNSPDALVADEISGILTFAAGSMNVTVCATGERSPSLEVVAPAIWWDTHTRWLKHLRSHTSTVTLTLTSLTDRMEAAA